MGSAEGKIEQILDLEAEKEFGDHIWSFDSTHEYFDFREYEHQIFTELGAIFHFRFWIHLFSGKKNGSSPGDGFDL